MGDGIQHVAIQNWQGGLGPLLAIDNQMVVVIDNPFSQGNQVYCNADMIGLALLTGVLGLILLVYGIIDLTSEYDG